jgi:NAD(P)-dependent dehydrogenase (short-subunit alcohol dehydrogenase family)
MEPLSFDGQVAIVTGAGGGLGRTHALELARRGAFDYQCGLIRKPPTWYRHHQRSTQLSSKAVNNLIKSTSRLKNWPKWCKIWRHILD